MLQNVFKDNVYKDNKMSRITSIVPANSECFQKNLNNPLNDLGVSWLNKLMILMTDCVKLHFYNYIV